MGEGLGGFLGKRLNTNPAQQWEPSVSSVCSWTCRQQGCLDNGIFQQSRETGWRWSGDGRRAGVQTGIFCGIRQPKISLGPFLRDEKVVLSS